MVAARNILRRRRLPAIMVAPRLRCVGAWTAGLALLTLIPPATVAADALTEHEVKAAFVYNFVKFVDWPPSKLNPGDERIFLCVVGEDAVVGRLEADVDGKVVRGKRLTVARLHLGDGLQHCHVLFVGHTYEFDRTAVLDEVRDAHVLTVGDSEDFAVRGGMINFRMQDRKVRFEINAAAAQRADLRISSQLLKLAIRLIAEPAPEQ